MYRRGCEAGDSLSCVNHGAGFACRVLAYHYELGDFGAYDPAAIPSLLARACRGGDPDACGEPKTAGETFN